jgi:hypothetical protein
MEGVTTVHVVGRSDCAGIGSGQADSNATLRLDCITIRGNPVAQAEGRYILTGDELWFYFTINPDPAWVPEGAVTPARSGQTISSPKRMLIISWSPLGFPSFKFFQNHIVLRLNIPAIIFFTKLIESVQQPLTKMLDKKSSSISTMQPVTLQLQAWPFWIRIE